MSLDFVFEPPQQPAIPVEGEGPLFPLRRIFCVGRNYAAHAIEMGNEVDREAPFYFTKSAQCLCHTGSVIDYPVATQDCHYEMEFCVAIGAEARQVDPEAAMDAVFGYACGIDLTRRDLQAVAKHLRRPWDVGKDFENAAILGPVTRKEAFGAIGAQTIWLEHDGARVQAAPLSDMIWSVPEIISDLSKLYTLLPGDLIMTGTPAGVGAVHPGSRLEGSVDGLVPVRVEFRA
ncbi:fumarylacetoacetate hydrolase family protein [Roseovarius aestuariivivens]|uniref:fumarylacetoacetate hydrolase family protein n=1 Tax=Roseovarius aestuariivivens TaxID=1888910 RepID=UPI001080750A|nr:fumarylacetoacetate hydrolase family protein [Roseovarius aestuariivivens]